MERLGSYSPNLHVGYGDTERLVTFRARDEHLVWRTLASIEIAVKHNLVTKGRIRYDQCESEGTWLATLVETIDKFFAQPGSYCMNKRRTGAVASELVNHYDYVRDAFSESSSYTFNAPPTC